MDDRWFQSIRRSYWGDSRSDVLRIMKASIKALAWHENYYKIEEYRKCVVYWYINLYGESKEIKDFEHEVTCPPDFNHYQYTKIHQHRLPSKRYIPHQYCMGDYINQPFEKPNYKLALTREECQQFLLNEPDLQQLWMNLTPNEQIKQAQNHWRTCGVKNPTRSYKKNTDHKQSDLPKITDEEAIKLVENTECLKYFAESNKFTENKSMLAHIGRMWLRKWGPRVLRVLK